MLDIDFSIKVGKIVEKKLGKVGKFEVLEPPTPASQNILNPLMLVVM